MPAQRLLLQAQQQRGGGHWGGRLLLCLPAAEGQHRGGHSLAVPLREVDLPERTFADDADEADVASVHQDGPELRARGGGGGGERRRGQ